MAGKIYTANEAAKELGVTPREVRQLVRDDSLKGYFLDDGFDA